ncbi:hypothetical protein SDC9_193972 [bioreactor metagenome]|uniref:Uncharacterized protein n=1 Tax=bioreactor metagenome TaxID=1076179 RepID=A0A645I669_9ZZZZ
MQDDRRVDVGRNAHREDRELAERTTREQIEEAKDVVVGDGAFEEFGVHTRNRNKATEPVDHDQRKRDDDLLTNLLDLERVDECLEH